LIYKFLRTGALPGIPILVAVPANAASHKLKIDRRALDYARSGQARPSFFRSALDGTWARLKVCAEDACMWAFYDRSKNRSGNWCSMAVCGNRMKARRHYQRARATPPVSGATH